MNRIKVRTKSNIEKFLFFVVFIGTFLMLCFSIYDLFVLKEINKFFICFMFLLFFLMIINNFLSFTNKEFDNLEKLNSGGSFKKYETIFHYVKEEGYFVVLHNLKSALQTDSKKSWFNVLSRDEFDKLKRLELFVSANLELLINNKLETTIDSEGNLIFLANVKICDSKENFIVKNVQVFY